MQTEIEMGKESKLGIRVLLDEELEWIAGGSGGGDMGGGSTSTPNGGVTCTTVAGQVVANIAQNYCVTTPGMPPSLCPGFARDVSKVVDPTCTVPEPAPAPTPTCTPTPTPDNTSTSDNASPSP